MLIFKILIIIAAILAVGWFLIIGGFCIWGILQLSPFIKKEQLLMRYGYEWDSSSEYWINKKLDVSIPYQWFVEWSYQRLADYVERRASH